MSYGIRSREIYDIIPGSAQRSSVFLSFKGQTNYPERVKDPNSFSLEGTSNAVFIHQDQPNNVHITYGVNSGVDALPDYLLEDQKSLGEVYRYLNCSFYNLE